MWLTSWFVERAERTYKSESLYSLLRNRSVRIHASQHITYTLYYHILNYALRASVIITEYQPLLVENCYAAEMQLCMQYYTCVKIHLLQLDYLCLPKYFEGNVKAVNSSKRT